MKLMTRSIYQLGYYASMMLVIDGLVYLAALTAVLVSGVMPPIEPYQSIISVASLLAGPILLLVLASLHRVLPEQKRVFTNTALSLATIFAALTSINRYVALTVVRQSLDAGLTNGLEWFMPYGWPSVMAAIEVLAWGFFLGLTFLSLTPIFFGSKGLQCGLFWTLLISGIFCLVGTLGQVINLTPVFMVGIGGWGFGFTVIAALLAAWFRRGLNLA